MGKRRRSIKKQPESPPPPASPATHAPCPVPSPIPSPVPPAPEQAPEVLVPPDWASAAALISSDIPPPVVLVCGPANSGKSTFSRLLINSLLPRYGRVGYLDTDVGQPEFSPPGCLSVHVVDEPIADLRYPVFREAERCCFYGDISSKRDPETYLNSLFLLYTYFVEKYRSPGSEVLPLIVNTPGWVKGTGFDMLVEMLRYICPTVVVQIRTRMQRKNLPDGMFWLDDGQAGPNVIIIDAACHKSLSGESLKRKDGGGTRERRLVEYFKQCFPSDISLATNKELAYALASLPPYEVSFSDVTVTHLHYEVPRTEIWRSLNATIVGLANSCDTAQAVPWCVGLGIVRGIDVQRGLLYVITPVPVDCLQSIDLLLQGLIDIPRSIMQVKGCISPYMSTNLRDTIRERDLYARNLNSPLVIQNGDCDSDDSDSDAEM
ncbi:polynucleotide 5'-hydroxyl-kinase NOL9-like [Lolium rigidum]|uniref:polynucleotide 5'-hydroxyl-kinase NOL9-like n=1 Tax=Lolium rigidum TaxID=89674 RepID=UPI001F5E2B86|nr:polynucleotide 5'-hydroxyl-kinase NOL9-like [Lolium rigidum]